MGMQEWQDSSPLCCCEYWNIQQERSHILGCFCNCDDLDDGVERLRVFLSACELHVFAVTEFRQDSNQYLLSTMFNPQTATRGQI